MSFSGISVEQLIGLVKNLPDDQKRRVFQELAKEMRQKRQRLMQKAQKHIRALAASRGLDRDTMNDEKRLQFIDDLIHEERGCL